MKRPLLLAAAVAAGYLAASPASAVISISSDPILFWNNLAIQNLVGGLPGAPLLGGAPGQTRGYAMVNIAMHDAVNATLGGPNNSYLTGVSSFGGDTRAAAAQAAYDVIVGLRGSSNAQLDQALSDSLAMVSDGGARANGASTGSAYASAVFANRAGDGSSNPNGIVYTTTGLAGDWRPTSAGNPAVPFWGEVKPFTMASGEQFRAGSPPALDSAEYTAAYNEVKAIGASNAEAMGVRTSDQTASALFWDAAAGGPWMQIGLAVAEDEGLSTLGNARAFALLSTSLADAIIGGFDSKYDYRLWRPQTAIREGAADGNDDTVGDASWTSLFSSPLHPSYISTHSALSGAGATVLSSIFGDDEGFTISIAGDTRSFTGLQQAALDGANSRLWGGIHFSFDNAAGLTMGRQIGANALSGPSFQAAAVPEPASWAMMIVGFGLLGAAVRRVKITASFVQA
jgi:hypothetical protein